MRSTNQSVSVLCFLSSDKCMRIAIVHYHLQRGGVCRVIEHTVAAIPESDDVLLLVLTGQPPADDFHVPHEVVSGLQYEAFRPAQTSRELAQDLKDAARRGLGDLPDVWHFHNHNLGKNMALPGVIRQLAEEGQRLLLHIHDFAEDGRPANYHLMLDKVSGHDQAEMARFLYPLAEHIHYAVLNSRDFSFLLDSGADPSCLHLLANPVKLYFDKEKKEKKEVSAEQRLFLYPTRAIRRKNLGEFILWAAVSSGGDRFATTMGPENPRERVRYEDWQRFAHELDLPVEFELAMQPGQSFTGLLEQSYQMITTSVAEGFGLAFLEPWLADRSVCGRDLPEITRGFADDGISLPSLYERLDVPVNWLCLGRLSDKAMAGYEQCLSAYGREPENGAMERIMSSWLRDGMVDFGRLDEEMQQQVIRRVVNNPDEAAAMLPACLPVKADEKNLIRENKKILEKKYSLHGYGKQLLSIYNQLAASRPQASLGATGGRGQKTEDRGQKSENIRQSRPRISLGAMDGERLLDNFLAPERLNLLRVD